MELRVYTLLPKTVRFPEVPYHLHIAIPVLLPSHTKGQIVGAVRLKYFCAGPWSLYSSKVTLPFFSASSSVWMVLEVWAC